MSIIGELTDYQKRFLLYMSADIIAEQWKQERRELKRKKMEVFECL